MANEQNLIPFTSDQSREEAKKNGQKGGIASGEKRRKVKSLKEALSILLEMDHTSKSGETKTGYEIVAIGLYNKAVKGDTKAAKLLAELVEQYKHLADITSNGQTINVAVRDASTKEDIDALK